MTDNSVSDRHTAGTYLTVRCHECDRDKDARLLPKAQEKRGECETHGPIYEEV